MPRTLSGVHKKNGSEMRHYKIKKNTQRCYIYVPGTINWLNFINPQNRNTRDISVILISQKPDQTPVLRKANYFFNIASQH